MKAFRIATPNIKMPRFGQIMIWFGLISTILLLWASNTFLTDRFTIDQREESLMRSGLYASSIASALQRSANVPLLLSRDQTIITALQSNDFQNTSQRLISFKEDLSVASLFLMDVDGRVVAASDRRDLGTVQDKPAFFVRALRESETVFDAYIKDDLVDGFFYARKIVDGTKTIGVIVVEVDLQRQERIWRLGDVQIVLSDSTGLILLASDLEWRLTKLDDLLSVSYRPTASERFFGGTSPSGPQSFVYLNGQRLLVSQVKIGVMGWKLSYFASLENVQARVNAIIALELMLLSLIATLVFFFISRKKTKQSVQLRQETDQLKRLNSRLSSEIEHRQKIEKNLETAEQSLEQSSKLAALGQMSAAVSHELNQPLAAMRTYLAGARLLLQRNRVDEALVSFQRIDDLIERMGVITRQLKSHARKSTGEHVMIDLRDCAQSALSLMSPQLGQIHVNIIRNFPKSKVMILGDAVKIEQIIVNLLRNALDAVKLIEDKTIIITIKVADSITLSVQDNGTGIVDADALFEPFSTTKKPGEGVGLGLAISAGFAVEMGGKLTGRNVTPVGAIFELQLPKPKVTKA